MLLLKTLTLWLQCLVIVAGLVSPIFAGDAERYKEALQREAKEMGLDCRDLFLDRPNEVAMKQEIMRWSEPIGFFAGLDKQDLWLLRDAARGEVNQVNLSTMFVSHRAYNQANYIWAHLMANAEAAQEIGERYANRNEWSKGLPAFIVLEYQDGVPYSVMIPAVVFPDAARKLREFIPTLQEVTLIGQGTRQGARVKSAADLQQAIMRIYRTPLYQQIAINWEHW